MKAVLEYLQQELNEGWDVREEIAEVEKAIAELEEFKRKAQKSYTLGYIQGYLDFEKNKTPKAIIEILKDKDMKELLKDRE